MTKLLPDTNVLVYDTLEDSDYHDMAVKVLDWASEIFIPPIVVHEYVWVMLKFSVAPRIVSSKVREYLEDPRTKTLDESINIIERALRMLEEEKAPPKDINDYIILSLALKNEMVLATFDKELKSIASKKGLKTVP